MSAAVGLISTHSDLFGREIDTELPVRMALDRELFASLGCYYFALDAFNKQETGVAVAYCQLALVTTIYHPLNS